MSDDSLLSLQDFEVLAQQRVNRVTWEYWANGSGDNSSVRENRRAYENYRIRSRALRNVENIDFSVEVLGQRLNIPVGIAPSGWHKMANPAGEAGTARAAQAFGTAMGVSMGTAMAVSPAAACSPEEVKAAGGNSVKFFQLYIFKNRNATRQLLQRVEEAGYEAIMLTVDTAYVGRRVSEIRNRPLMPGFLKKISFGSQLSHPTLSNSATTKEQNQEGFTMDSSLEWAEDAQLAVEHKVDGIIVSNHGGRQLDGSVATIDVLPEVVAAVRGAIPVHLDGGIRRGVDIFRALALGADFVWIGRPALWGLACDGQRGVESILKILTEELKICMGLTGCTSVRDITKDLLRIKASL